MNDIFEWSLQDWMGKALDIFWYVADKWYFLVLGLLLGAIAGYWPNRNAKPTYTATISFVLSTESGRGGGAGLAGLAAQLGLDAGTAGPDNVFSGDNIIELFKSKKMITQALLSEADSNSHQTLLEFIAARQYPASRNILPFPADPKKFNAVQTAFIRRIISVVNGSFDVFKKDKKLIFYNISATSGNQDVAYYTAKCMLEQTSRFFIATKTSAATRGLNLLQKEADSLGMVLGGAYRSTASLADRTYNINPSLMVQRSVGQLTQARASALAAAYTEVMRNLEIAKINVQKETPLYSVIDEPDLPLTPQKMNVKRHSILTGIAGLALTIIVLCGIRFYTIIKPFLFKHAE